MLTASASAEDKDSLSADAIKPLGSQGFVQPASSPTILSGGPQEGSLRVSKRFCCLSLGVRIHRSVLQIASGKFMSILVIHVASLASSLPFERILVLREDGFTDSNLWPDIFIRVRTSIGIQAY